MKLKLAAVSLALLVPTSAFFVGVNSGADSLRNKQLVTATETSNQKPTTYTHETVRTVTEVKTVYVQPESCAKAAALSVELYNLHYQFDQDSGDLTLLFDTINTAIALKQVTTLNKAKLQVRDLHDKTLATELAISYAITDLKKENDDCMKDLPH